MVPISAPVPVSSSDQGDWAIPKSVTFTRPSRAMSRLPGLMSRCSTPAACAACSAAAAWAITSAVRPGSSGPDEASTAASEGPSTSSMTRKAGSCSVASA